MEQTKHYIDDEGNTIQFSDNALKIRQLNDRARQFAHTECFGNYKTVLSDGVAFLVETYGGTFLTNMFIAVRDFDDFSYENDPWGEHDFGAFDVDGFRMYFKIDYYTLDGKAGSPDPTDERKTMRVLTIMQPDEY